jgi:phage tail-like protein
MTVLSNNPYSNDLFSVEIPEIELANFEQVLLPEMALEVIEYREGNEASLPGRKLPGRPSFTTLVLRRGYRGSRDLFEWWDSATQGASDARRTVLVKLLDDEHNPVTTWKFKDTSPARYVFSTLDAQDGGVLVESLELAFDSMEME